MLAVLVRVGLAEGAFTTVAGVFGGAVEEAEVMLVVDLTVMEGGAIIGAERLVNVTGVVEVLVAMGEGVDLIFTLAEGSGAGVESELSLTD